MSDEMEQYSDDYYTDEESEYEEYPMNEESRTAVFCDQLCIALKWIWWIIRSTRSVLRWRVIPPRNLFMQGKDANTAAGGSLVISLALQLAIVFGIATLSLTNINDVHHASILNFLGSISIIWGLLVYAYGEFNVKHAYIVTTLYVVLEVLKIVLDIASIIIRSLPVTFLEHEHWIVNKDTDRVQGLILCAVFISVILSFANIFTVSATCSCRNDDPAYNEYDEELLPKSRASPPPLPRKRLSDQNNIRKRHPVSPEPPYNPPVLQCNQDDYKAINLETIDFSQNISSPDESRASTPLRNPSPPDDRNARDIVFKYINGQG